MHNHLYCCNCGNFVTKDQAQVLFRTGFYKIVHPLAYCTDCARQDSRPYVPPAADEHTVCPHTHHAGIDSQPIA